MKISTFFLSSILLSVSVGGNAQQRTLLKDAFKTHISMLRMLPVESTDLLGLTENRGTAIWKPLHETMFLPDGDSWIYAADYTYVYDKKGNVLENSMTDGESTLKRTNTYDENGQITLQIDEESEDGNEFTASSKRLQEYDKVVTNFITKHEVYLWDSDAQSWTAGSNFYKTEITRDSKNRVVEVVTYDWDEQSYFPNLKNEIVYDEETNKPKEFVKYVNQFPGSQSPTWAIALKMKDMVWKTTDNQLVGDINTWYEGNNLVAKATVYTVGEDGQDKEEGIYNVTYDDKGGFVVTVESVDKTYKGLVEKKYTDENGSYELVNKEYQEQNGDGQLTEDEVSSFLKQVQTYDSHRNITGQAQYDALDENGQEVMTYATKFENKYDSEHDALAEVVTLDYDTDLAEYVPTMKVVSDQFVDVTNTDGILRPVVNQKTSGKAIYNAQGVFVGSNLNKLPQGLYFVKERQKTAKIIKR